MKTCWSVRCIDALEVSVTFQLCLNEGRAVPDFMNNAALIAPAMGAFAIAFQEELFVLGRGPKP